MNTTIFKISAVILLFALMGAGCKKEKNDYDPDSIIGKWKWIYSQGGFAGTTYPQEGQTVIWTFTEDSSLIVPEGWGITSNSKFHVSGNALKLDGSDLLMYTIKLSGDTLHLFPLNSFPFSHHFKHIN